MNWIKAIHFPIWLISQKNSILQQHPEASAVRRPAEAPTGIRTPRWYRNDVGLTENRRPNCRPATFPKAKKVHLLPLLPDSNYFFVTKHLLVGVCKATTWFSIC